VYYSLQAWRVSIEHSLGGAMFAGATCSCEGISCSSALCSSSNGNPVACTVHQQPRRAIAYAAPGDAEVNTSAGLSPDDTAGAAAAVNRLCLHLAVSKTSAVVEGTHSGSAPVAILAATGCAEQLL
jgi:hypothetical protein